jgi:hypothetical protein
MTITIEPRPSIGSDAIINKVAECLINDMAILDPDVSHRDKLIYDVLKTLKIEHDWDGYNLAKTLEDAFHWSCNTELVSILDNADLYRSQHHSACVREWVERNKIAPKLCVGDLCKYLDGKTKRVGEIVKVDAKHALYLVRFDSLGHVKSGEGTHGLLLPSEKVSGEGEVSE